MNLNLNYELKTLQCIAAIKISQNIIDVNRLCRDFYSMETVLQKCEELLQKLDIPKSLKKDIRLISRHIFLEMNKWYQRYGDGARLVLTSHGTVDAEKSARVIFDTDQPIVRQYKVACDLCLEDDIFRLGQRLSKVERFEYNCGHGCHEQCLQFDALHHRESLASFWFCVYKSQFRRKISRPDLSAEMRAVGFARARYGGNTLALKYFLEGASEATVRLLRSRDWFVRSDHGRMPYPKFCPSFPPAMADALLRMMGEGQTQRIKLYVLFEILHLFLQWPCQHLFLNTAESLIRNFNALHCWKVLAAIAVIARDGDWDGIYKGLFVDFWKLGWNYASLQTDVSVSWLSFYVFLMRDEPLAILVFDKISDEHKERHLFNFDKECFCLNMIYARMYDAIELLVMVCRARDERLFLKFKKFWTDHSTLRLSELNAPVGETLENSPILSQYERRVRMLEFLKIMSKYAQPPSAALSLASVSRPQEQLAAMPLTPNVDVGNVPRKMLRRNPPRRARPQGRIRA